MKNFRPGGGGRSGSSRFGGRPQFGRSTRPEGRGRAGGPPELFDTTCSRCGKPTLVPFRPNGKKPVFCRDCFSRENYEQGKGEERDNFPPRKFQQERGERQDERSFDRRRKDREDRPSRPEQRHDLSTKRETQDLQIHALQKELHEIKIKLDQLLALSRGADVRSGLAEIAVPAPVAKNTKNTKSKKAVKKSA